MNGPSRVCTVGAGIGGVALAVALGRHGTAVELVERAPRLERAGAGLLLWPNALAALAALGLEAAMIERGRVVARMEIRRSDGRLLSAVDARAIAQACGHPLLAAHRGELQAVMLEKLPAGALHTGAECVGAGSAPHEAWAEVAGGGRVRAPVVVGADGLRSRVREAVRPGLQPRYSGYTAWRGVVRGAGAAAAGTVSESWGRGARFGIVPLAGDEVYWFATDTLPPGSTPTSAARAAHLRARFHGWHAPVEALLEATPPGEILQTDLYDLPPVRGWSARRLVLLGDAIHPTTPNLGQGAAMALESAVVLAEELLRGGKPEAAFRRYEGRRRRRTAAVTRASWRLGRLAQASSAVGAALRDLSVHLSPERAMRRSMLRFARPVVGPGALESRRRA